MTTLFSRSAVSVTCVNVPVFRLNLFAFTYSATEDIRMWEQELFLCLGRMGDYLMIAVHHAEPIINNYYRRDQSTAHL